MLGRNHGDAHVLTALARDVTGRGGVEETVPSINQGIKCFNNIVIHQQIKVLRRFEANKHTFSANRDYLFISRTLKYKVCLRP